MSYSISSNKLQHPLLKPIFEKLIGFFSGMNMKFYVIGATARDIIMAIHGEKARRATRDLDIAIAISDWEQFDRIEKGIMNIDGFTKDTKQKQRFMYDDVFQIDIVPFGDIRKEDDRIFWPPDETMAMSEIGFAEAMDSTTNITVDDSFSIDVASLDGIFVLKLNAWIDRHELHNRDADDIGFILTNYLNINEERASAEHYNEIYLADDFNLRTAGAKLLGLDVAKLIGNNFTAKEKIIKIIQMEIDQGESSKLINQIIETNKTFRYEEVLMCLKNIIEGLK